MNNLTQTSYLIIDWGTTNFRAFAMSESHQLLATKEENLGLLQVQEGKFAETLAQILADWLVDYTKLPIYMAGMVGSAKGWHNVEYVQTSVTKKALVNNVYSFALPWGAKAIIIPGICHQFDQDKYDVMRGEEVQIFGLANIIKKQNFVAILPGTHSKHAHVVDGCISEFSSYLTGEFYSILLQHSLLGKGLQNNTVFDQSAFAKGVEEGRSGELTNRVFLAWTHRLFSHLTEDQIPDYLSGLLIGYELSGSLLNNKETRTISDNTLYLVGGQSLCHRYQVAASQLGINTHTISGNDCFLAGMNELIQELNHD